jgi:hypothetical protein
MYNIKGLFNNLSQLPGWHTKRKIIIIESDDWGSIRMPSKYTIELLKTKGVQVNDPYNLNDSLASEEDLSCLFEVLTSFKDSKGNHPVITANTIMTNPDFDKIRESDFKEYHYELFTDTLQRYPQQQQSFGLWKEGLQQNIFFPQYHGREHVNIFRWLIEVQHKHSNARIGFDHYLFGLREEGIDMRKSFMRALDFETYEQLFLLKKNLKEGLQLFKDTFGYHSKSFIAPSYIWNDKIEEVLYNGGIHYLQGIAYQYIPKVGSKKLTRKWHHTGERNDRGQLYLVRNAFFEPSLTKHKTIEETLQRIEIAFRWKKPAIIGSHRLNFIGYINQRNRDTNLKLFTSLLQTILQRWPDVEFMTSDRLGEIIKLTKNGIKETS